MGAGNLAARIIFIPPHTTGHVEYYFEREKCVFTGDTLFVKHYFTGADTGAYGCAGTLSRALIWLVRPFSACLIHGVRRPALQVRDRGLA